MMITLPADVLAYVLAEKSTSFQVSLAFQNIYVQFNGTSLATKKSSMEEVHGIFIFDANVKILILK